MGGFSGICQPFPASSANAVITGFNTDIEFQGITYHVQTEDKGVDTPLILSLVYNRGTILASKRSPYDDLLSGNFDEKLLIERLQKQHKLICAAVRAGRIEDLKRMTEKVSASKRKKIAAPAEIKAEVAKPSELPKLKKETESAPVLPDAKSSARKKSNLPLDLPPPKNQERSAPGIPKPKEEFFLDVPDNIDVPENIFDEPIIEGAMIIEDEIILPTDAVEIISGFPSLERIVDNSLKIKLLGNENFRAGERKTISILVFRGTPENCLSGAHIMVKVLGSAFRPLIFHAKTDSSGMSFIHLQLPHFRSGRGAILIRAMSDGEEIDLRRVIEQG